MSTACCEKKPPALSQTIAQLEKIRAGDETKDAIGILCDVLLDDLAILGSSAKESSVKEVCREINKDKLVLTYFKIRDGSCAGSYIGVGIGPLWMNFGFVENDVIRLLRQRFQQQGALFHETQSKEIKTWLGPVTHLDEFYQTHDDVFVLSHTYSWFVRRRVK